MSDRPCSHGPGCQLPWSVHDWSYEADVQAASTTSQTVVTYTDDSGRWQFVHCARHAPLRYDAHLRNVTTEPTSEPCSLGCNPRLNWRAP